MEALYRAPLDQFVARRKEAALQARKAGHRDLAKRLQALAKPSVAAWLANQLYFEEPAAWNHALQSATNLRQSQQQGGLPAQQMQAQVAERRAAVQQLVRLGQQLATVNGQRFAASHMRRLQDLVEAVLAAPDAVQLGRLSQDLSPPSFDVIDARAVLAAKPPQAPPAREPLDSQGADAGDRNGTRATAQQQPSPEVADRDLRAARALKEHLQQAYSARKLALDRAQAARDRAHAELVRCQQALRTAETELAQTEQRLADARAQREAAGKALERGDQELTRAQAALERGCHEPPYEPS